MDISKTYEQMKQMALGIINPSQKASNEHNPAIVLYTSIPDINDEDLMQLYHIGNDEIAPIRFEKFRFASQKNMEFYTFDPLDYKEVKERFANIKDNTGSISLNVILFTEIQRRLMAQFREIQRSGIIYIPQIDELAISDESTTAQKRLDYLITSITNADDLNFLTEWSIKSYQNYERACHEDGQKPDPSVEATQIYMIRKLNAQIQKTESAEADSEETSGLHS